MAAQRCISKLSEHWTSEQYDAVVEMFQMHGLQLVNKALQREKLI